MEVNSSACKLGVRKVSFVFLILTFKNIFLYCHCLVHYVKLKKKVCFFLFFAYIGGLPINYAHNATYCIGLCTYARVLGHYNVMCNVM